LIFTIQLKQHLSQHLGPTVIEVNIQLLSNGHCSI